MSQVTNRRLNAFRTTVLVAFVSVSTFGGLGGGTANAEPLVRLETDFGDIVIDMRPDAAPATVENFLTYVNSGAFDDSLFHRNPAPGNFVLQGGQAFWPVEFASFANITPNPPVDNEFNISNTRGTVAMAKLDGQPNSATNNYFINLADNSANLDVQNEGFTVFGTINEAGMAVVDSIAALPITSILGLGDSVPTANATVVFQRSVAVIINTVSVLSQVSAPAAAVLPSSRSVSTGAVATGFATIINGAAEEAVGCTMQPITEVDSEFFYRRTNPVNNEPFGINNPVLDIASGGLVSLLFTFTPTASFANTTIEFGFECLNTEAAATLVTGVNTFDLAASSTPIADVVALGGTVSNDGIANISLNAEETVASGAFSVATFNLGAAETITVSADTGGATLPIGLFVCPTDAQTGDCLDGTPPAVSASVDMGSNETGTFAVFAQQINPADTINFDPASNRAFVRFRNASGDLRGSTSVALRTAP